MEASMDEGLWANNPVLIGLIDALDLTEPGQEIQIFSLGTCAYRRRQGSERVQN
jgi:hypothetical protein